jgi:type II secretory pathway pseudopilin PulG
MMRQSIHHSSGFTYLTLLILIAVIGLASLATIQIGSILQRRAAEEELLAIGSEFQSALVSYASATPTGLSPFPSSLQDLVKDPRYPTIRRHLRQIYMDPLTGQPGWGTVTSPDENGIIGVYSLSKDTPIKVGNFEPQFYLFEGKTSYRDWVFSRR